ncbi:MAG: peptidoglycan-binding protein, partial [Pseudomonadota bacterium]
KGPHLTAHPSGPKAARTPMPPPRRRVWRNLAASIAAIAVVAGGAYVGVTVAGPTAQQTPELAAGGYILRADIAAAPAPSPSAHTPNAAPVPVVPTPVAAAPAAPTPVAQQQTPPEEGVQIDPKMRPVEPVETAPAAELAPAQQDPVAKTELERAPDAGPNERLDDTVAFAPVLANPKPGAKAERRKTLTAAKLDEERQPERAKTRSLPQAPADAAADPAVSNAPAQAEPTTGVEPARSLAGMPLGPDNWSVADVTEPRTPSQPAPVSIPEVTQTDVLDPSESQTVAAVPTAPNSVATTDADAPGPAATPATPLPMTAVEILAQIEPSPGLEGWLPSAQDAPAAASLTLADEPFFAPPDRANPEMPTRAALPPPSWMAGLQHHAKLLGQPAEQAAMSLGVDALDGLLDSGLSGQIVTPRAQPVPVVIRRSGARILFNHALSRCGGVLEPISAQPDGVIFRERPYPNGGCGSAGWVRLAPVQDQGALYAWAETPAGPWTTTAHLTRDAASASRLHHALPAFADHAEIDPERQEALLALVRNDRKEIQSRLRLAGFDPKGVDGLFGPATRTAITEWQTARGFEATGYLNAAQKALLEDETDDRYVPPTPRVATRTERLWSSIRQSTRSIGPSACRRDQNGRPLRGYETRCAADGKNPSADR